ncbi:MAG: hypothetical protein IKL49_06475 [Lachnospiraceae bacterium]|nr:hypothetical protein [Lachnospiraceae bacterium]
MLFGKDSFRKKNIGKYIIGYELGKKHVQISYLKIGDKEPETFSTVAGQEQYNIPFVMYKQEDKNLWYIGKEALAKYEEMGGVLLTDLLENAYRQETTEVNLETYDSAALLALFVKRSLSYLSFVAPVEKQAAIMFTVETLNQKTVEVLREMVEYLQMPQVLIQFMGKEESFFYYNLHTDPSLWANRVYMYEMQENKLQSYQLYLNRQTKPVVTLIEKKEYEEFPMYENEEPTGEEKEVRDQIFLEYVTEDMEEKIVSTVYLIGDGFLGEWYQKSVRFLCGKRRVFLGNNLYSKGACFALLDKMEPTELSVSYVYLGTDKVKANVGMELIRQGAPSYLAILDGGSSWYDCKKEWDMILEGDNRLVFRITPLDGKNTTRAEIVLHGLLMNKSPLCRIRAEGYMENPTTLKLKFREMGFGEFYPSQGQYWEETIEL